MRRIFALGMLIVASIYFSSFVLASDNKITVTIDGNRLESEPGAYVIEGTTYVPLFPLCKSIDAEVRQNTDDSIDTYTITKPNLNRVITLKSKSKIVEVNGIVKEIDLWPILIAANDKLSQTEVLVPLVFIVEQLGGEAIWDPVSGNVSVISYKPISFEDDNLEAEVRLQIKVPDGDILKGDVRSVEMLIIPNKNITSIEGLQSFSNLTYLDISNNSIEDLTPLNDLGNLSTLYLKGNPATDYSITAAYYNNLKKRDFEIKIEFNDKKLENAIRQVARKTLNSRLTLDDLKGITELSLQSQGISDLHGIQNLINLSELDLTDNNIKNAEPLKSLTGIKKLSLSSNNLENIESLKHLKNLDYLDLDSNNIADLSPLAFCTKLTQLSAMNNKIFDTVNLSNLLMLEILDLGENNIKEIEGLDELVNLKELYLNTNQFSSVSNLSSLTNLEVLDLSENNITEIDAFDKLFRLKSLYLNTNSISDIKVIEKLFNLKVLDLANNKIINITSLNKLKSLTTLFLKGNEISEFSPIMSYYNNLTNKDFELEGVPLNSSIELRFYIGKSLYYINGIETNMDSIPEIKEGRTFLPVRYVSEPIGAQVAWDAIDKKVTLTLGNDIIELIINKDVARVNDSIKPIDTPATIVNGRTMLPIRFVGESLGLTVVWNPEKREVILTK